MRTVLRISPSISAVLDFVCVFTQAVVSARFAVLVKAVLIAETVLRHVRLIFRSATVLLRPVIAFAVWHFHSSICLVTVLAVSQTTADVAIAGRTWGWRRLAAPRSPHQPSAISPNTRVRKAPCSCQSAYHLAGSAYLRTIGATTAVLFQP